MRVEDLDLPSEVKRALVRRGIVELYPPQEEAVRRGALEGKNILMCTPTASGKTLVALMAALKHALNGGKVLYLTPLRALASEKYEEFRDYAEEVGVRVALTTGDYDSSDAWLEGYDIIVTTNEKADSLLRHRPPWIGSLTLLVADEVHLINEERRGPTLEMVLARLASVVRDVQILALSATVRNAEELARWLDAEVVATEWRPVRLREGVYYDGEVYYGDGHVCSLPDRGNPVQTLALDCVEDGGQALIFASSRRSCVAHARRIAVKMWEILPAELRGELERLALSLLKTETNEIVRQLSQLARRGVAFHHAGLSYEIRRAIEEAFRNMTLKVIVATPTLAAGVNLPARRVIITDYKRYNVELGFYERISVIEYKQMAGRAGRPKYDKEGEAILIARTADELDMLLEDYVRGEPEPITSKLASEVALRSHVLAAVASGYSSALDDLLDLMGRTLYARQGSPEALAWNVRRTIQFLKEEGFITGDGKLRATPLGEKVSYLYIDPKSATVILRALKRGRVSILGYLHMVSSTPDMPVLYLRRKEFEKYDEKARECADELLLEPPEDPVSYEFYLASLKTAMMLRDWIEEVPDDHMIKEYDVGPGDIHNIAQTTEWLLYAAAEVAKEGGYLEHVVPLYTLRKRVKHGVREELLELVSIRGIGRVRARVLYNYGYRTLDDIRKATVGELARLPTIGTTLAKKLKAAVEGLSEVEIEGAVAHTLDQYL